MHITQARKTDLQSDVPSGQPQVYGGKAISKNR